MSKLYDKIFPNEPDLDDIKIYHNSVRLSWIEPINLIGNNNYIFDNFLPETKELLLQLDIEKSPLGKIDCLIEISNKIKNIIQFNNGSDVIGVDDSLPIFQYAVIKAQPNKFSSNHKYMSIITSNTEKKYEIFSVYVETSDFSYMNLKLSDEEFDNQFKMFKEKSLYDTGVEVLPNDEVLVLQTCSTHRDYSNYKYKYLLIILRRVL